MTMQHHDARAAACASAPPRGADTAKRVQMSRHRPWRAEHPDAIVVARPTAWGNPFVVGGWYVRVDGQPRPTRFPDHHPDAARVEGPALAVALYREHIHLHPQIAARAREVLAGYDLACWCPLDDGHGNRVPCHADVLLELANAAV